MYTTTIKTKTMRWVEHGARIERLKRSLYEMFNRQLSKGTGYLGGQVKAVRIVLQLMLMKKRVRVCIVFRWFRIGTEQAILCRNL